MRDKQVIILCRDRRPSIDVPRHSRSWLYIKLRQLKNKIFSRVTGTSSRRKIKSRILDNIMRPEWIGRYRFEIFDLFNFILNGRKYVYHPEKDAAFFSPTSISTITSLSIQDDLLKKGYLPVNFDNFALHRRELKAILRGGPLAVVISATYFMDAGEIRKIIAFIRAHNRMVPVIIGGGVLLTKTDERGRLPQPYETLLTDHVYVIIEEDGLDTLDTLLNRLSNAQDVSDIPNLVHRVDQTLAYTERKIFPVDWDAKILDWPRIAASAGDVAFVRASQGCAFRCKFCTFPKASLKFHQRSVSSVRAELRSIRDAGFRYLAFTDDHFAVSPRRIEEICRMMIEERFDFSWFAGIRSNSITASNVGLLKDSGCKVLCVGLESGDDRMLSLMAKKTTVADNTKCLELLSDNGIVAYGSFILGFPGETRQSIENTIDFINRSPLPLYKIYLFYLLKGSPVFDEQAQHEISYFGNEYDYCLWKTPSMDALEASEALKEFILKTENAGLIYNYSPMYAFFPFFLKGYSADDVVDFFKLKTRLVKNELSSAPRREKKRIREQGLMDMEAAINNRGKGTTAPH